MVTELQRLYLEGLPSRIATLEDARQRIALEGDDALAALMRIVHSLKGSGSTHGFPAVTAAAERVEAATESGREDALEALLEVLRELGEATNDHVAGRILLGTGDAGLATALRHGLGEHGLELAHVERADELIRIAGEGGFDLICLDLVLPDRDGRSLLLDLRDRPQLSEAPVIVLSGIGDDSVRNECLARGASACVTKPVDGAALAAEIAARLRSRPASRSAVEGYDRLTGLLGRRAFSDVFERLVALGDREGFSSTVALLDLDHLSRTNREGGMAAGDRLLQRLARLLDRHLRRCDVPARWGGEEFAVLFPAVDENEASRALQRIQDELGSEPAFEGAATPASFSAGVAAVKPKDDAAEAVARADWFLFYAKTEGRSRILCAGDKLHARPARSVLLVEDDPDMARMVRTLLEEQEIQVVHRSDGEAGLAAFLRSGFDLAILDIVMPHMDGLELLGRIRRSTTDGDLPVILLTGEGSETDIVRGFARGADDYVVKPFQAEELMARVRRLLPRETRRGR